MKNIIVLFVLLALACALTADAKSDALSSCDTAKDLIKSEDYQKAADELNFALSKVNEILAGALENYLPQAPGGYTETSREATSLGAAGAIVGSTNSLAASSEYEADNGSTIDVTITVGGAMGAVAGLASMGQMFGGASAGTESVRIKGYSGTLEIDKDDNSASLTLNIGGQISVIIDGSKIESGDILKEMAQSMDLSKLEKEF